MQIVDKARIVMDVQVVEVKQLRAKDAQILRSLIERRPQLITEYLYHLVKDHEVALDLWQDTLLNAPSASESSVEDLAEWCVRVLIEQALPACKPQNVLCMQIHDAPSFLY